MKESFDKDISYDVSLCDDGKYRWRYDLNLFKTAGIFLLIWKILFFIIFAIFAVSMISDAFRFSDFYPERFMYNLKFFAYFFIGMTAISLLSYLIYALIMGGKYCVIFEMDENGINHKQIPAQAEKAKKIAKATMLAGAASGRFSTIAVGRSAAGSELYTDFSKVKKLKSYPKRNLIKLSAPISHNQIYCKREDFEFVENYIISHCDKL